MQICLISQTTWCDDIMNTRT